MMKCVFCGKELKENEFNNIAPIFVPVREENQVCCSTCNDKYVLPARVNEHKYLKTPIGKYIMTTNQYKLIDSID